MTDHTRIDRRIKKLTIYYGFLQTVHMAFLLRAGRILLNSGRMPFPASPPVGGWDPQILPFFIGMGIADVIAAGIGFYFLYLILVKDTINVSLGIISLTTAFSSGLAFLIGTIASGAWNQHFGEYIILVLVSIPLLLLYLSLLRKTR